jgi:hypothetical protein
MWVLFLSFQFPISVAASQKTLILALQKWKRHFLWDETKIGLCGVPRHPKGHTHVSDMASFTQTMPWSWSNLAHFT